MKEGGQATFFHLARIRVILFLEVIRRGISIYVEEQIMTSEEEKPLKSIIGHQLSSVEFVMDYVQLRFDGPCLTAITLPTVDIRGRRFDEKTPCYRDALCECIGKKLKRATVEEGKQITLVFEDDSVISISLKPEDYVTAEAVEFRDDLNNVWYVW